MNSRIIHSIELKHFGEEKKTSGEVDAIQFLVVHRTAYSVHHTLSESFALVQMIASRLSKFELLFRICCVHILILNRLILKCDLHPLPCVCICVINKSLPSILIMFSKRF